MKHAGCFRLIIMILSVGSLFVGCDTSGGSPKGTVEAPQFTPVAGSYQADQSVAIGCGTGGAAIHYTTDGSAPTADSPLYTSPVSVAGDGAAMTIKAIAIKDGMVDSAAVSAYYAIDYGQVSTPQLSPGDGVYSSDQSVSIDCATGGATIHYTKDGSVPTASSPTYAGPIALGGDGTTWTVKAVAIKSGLTDSAVASAFYAIDYGQVSTPQFDPQAGVVPAAGSVSIGCSTSGATIRYTLDGSSPTAASPAYSSAIPAAGKGKSFTLKAAAFKGGMKDSTEASAFFVVDFGRVSDPVFDPPAGTYVAAQNVAISCGTKDTVLFYTVDGGDPETSGLLYTGPIQVSSDEVIRAIAYDYRTGLAASEVADAQYLFIPPVPVAGVVATAADNNKATVTWDPVANAESYDIYYKQGSGVTTSNGTKVSNATSPCTISGLATDAYYSFIVAAKNENGVGAASAAVSAKIQGRWELLGAAGFSAGGAENTELAVAPNGTVYVVYMDAANNGRATVRYYGPGGWATLGAAGFSADSIASPRIAIDSSNVVYVAYRTDRVFVQRFNTSLSQWEPVGSDMNGIAAASTLGAPSLAIGPDKAPYIAFIDQGAGNKATAMRFDGSSWQLMGAAGFSEYPVLLISGSIGTIAIAIGADGAPYVAYGEFVDSATMRIQVKKYSGSAWGESLRAGLNPIGLRIMTDSASVPYVGYTAQAPAGYGTPDRRPRMTSYRSIDGSARFYGLPTTTSGSDDPLVYSSYTDDYSIALDADDVAYAAFTSDVAPYGGAMVRRFNAVSRAWEGVGLDRFSAGSAYNISIGIGPGGRTPYVAFVDGANDGKATVMVYR